MFTAFTVITMIIVLAVAAVGGSISERTGIINLSIEGFMTIGAISYSLVAASKTFVGNTANQFWMMPIAMVFAGLFALIYGFVTVKLKANQTIAGIALNILALALSVFLIHSNVNPAGIDVKVQIQESLFAFSPDKSNVGSIFNIGLFLGIPTIILVVVMLNFTKFGTRLKACGEQPHAAASLGIKVERTQLLGVMIAGAVAGLAGAIFVQMKGKYFYGSTQGIGFLAVALVIFGQWRPSIIIGGAIMFGILYGVIETKEAVPGLSSISNPMLLNTIPYAFSLVVLVFTQKKSKAPKALGIPYMNQGR